MTKGGKVGIRMRMKIYRVLVNRVPAICKKYQTLRQTKPGITGRLYAWAALLVMNLFSIFFNRKWERELLYPDEKKRPPEGGSESSISKKEEPEVLAKRLAEYEIISFDVFDTLVLRPFSCPSDLFFRVGEKLGYLDFERIRREMEWKARKRAEANQESPEITLEDIYEELEIQAGIPKEQGMKAEIETELELCFGNPYMLEVLRHLQGCGKKIICITDMYLPSGVILEILKKCGYKCISSLFVSSEWKKAKGDGRLFAQVKEIYGGDKKYVHVGDNPESDIKMARKNGFAAEYYQNVNIAGKPYRAEDMSVIAGSLYRGIVNAHIHNGLIPYSREYELGFVYGGLFVFGYCQFIHEYIQCHKIDRILFLSRDGEILSKAYAILYPEESKKGSFAYACWSRLAAAKIGARDFKYDFFRRFLDHKVNKGYTLRQIFESMEIEDMLEQLTGELSGDMKFTSRSLPIVREYLLCHFEEVCAHYEEQAIAGKMYYEKLLKGCRRAAAVDVGWAGSGAISLNWIVNEIWHLDCEVVGLIAGTNSVHNAEPDMSEAFLADGRLVSYLFSQRHNREIWKWHDASRGHNLGLEFLCSSAKGSLRGFYLGKDQEGREFCQVRLKEPDIHEKTVKEIQRGILDFVGKMQGWQKKTGIGCVSGQDAYSVLKVMLNWQGDWVGSMEEGI